MKPEVVEEFGEKIRYFNTFGANTVSIAAAQAVLDIIKEERLGENAAKVGAYILDGMTRLAEKYERIGEARGAGLFLGLDFVKDRKTKEPDGETALNVVNILREKQVLISASSPSGHVLKIRPPLPFSIADADIFLERLGEAVSEATEG
jgi:4-aminobutyrate aminotransferase-like enzyme